MAQLLQTNPSFASIEAGKSAVIPAVSGGHPRVQPTVFSGGAAQSKKNLQGGVQQNESGFLDSLPIEHPLTIAYVSTCQQGNCMIYVGPQVANLGFEPEVWLGKQDLRLKRVHQDDLAQVEKALLDTINTAVKFSCCYRLYDSAGNVHWFHDEASVVPDESGAPLFIMGAMRDITEMKVMEAELNEHRYNLEQKVEQRTEQLMKRISLLESCNATLCDKLDHAIKDAAELKKQLASSTLADTNSGNYHKPLPGAGDSMHKLTVQSEADGMMGCAASA